MIIYLVWFKLTVIMYFKEMCIYLIMDKFLWHCNKDIFNKTLISIFDIFKLW